MVPSGAPLGPRASIRSSLDPRRPQSFFSTWKSRANRTRGAGQGVDSVTTPVWIDDLRTGTRLGVGAVGVLVRAGAGLKRARSPATASPWTRFSDAARARSRIFF